MVKEQRVLLASFLACIIASSGWCRGGDGSGGAESQMRLFVPPKWEFLVPNEVPLPLGAEPDGRQIIPVPHAGGRGFFVESDGISLGVDTNGDGKVDERVKGVGGSVVLKGKSSEGRAFSYAVRIINEGTAWKYLSTCAMGGKVAGCDIKLIDLNGNGRFDEFGTDAMIVGSGKAASLLSRTISISGQLYSLSVTPGGDSVKVEPCTTPTGTVNLASGFKSEGGELQSAVIANAAGDISFELSALKNGLTVPAGEYKLLWGFVRKGGETAKVRGTNCKPLTVEAGKSTSMAWGGPLDMDFEFSIDKDKLTVPPTVKFMGRGGEEYYEFKPDAKSPKIIVYDAETKAVVVEGRFGGC